MTPLGEDHAKSSSPLVSSFHGRRAITVVKSGRIPDDASASLAVVDEDEVAVEDDDDVRVCV